MDPKELKRINIAYFCYLWIAIVPWLESLGLLLPIPPELGQIILSVLSFPIVIGTLIAGVIALYQSWKARDHWPLLAMGLIAIAMLILVILLDLLMILDYTAASYGFLLSSLILLGLCVRWYFYERKKLKEGF